MKNLWEISTTEFAGGKENLMRRGNVYQLANGYMGYRGTLDEFGPDESVGITLAPMTKFPLVRDLIVDRSRMFHDLVKVKAWITLDGSHELGPGPRQAPENQEEAYPLSRCMTCGCCLEACPQVNDSSHFIGPRLLSKHPT